MTDRLRVEDIHTDVRKTFRFVPTPPIRHRWQRALARAGMALLPAPKLPDGMTHESLEWGQSAGVHVFTPNGGGGGAALLWIHGGGMVIGAAAQDHQRCADLAARLNIVVVSAEYRLAPEHPFPAPLDDCHSAWEWLLEHAAARGIDAERIAIGGQSAGGGLAAGLVLRVHDAGGPRPAAQWLFCPMLDDRTAVDRSRDQRRHYLWNNAANRVGWTAYLAGSYATDRVSEYAAPARRQDLTGLPPAWIGTGDIELFYDEDRRYAERMQAAGVDCTLDVIPGGPHAFESIASKTDVARTYTRRASDWLATKLLSDSRP